jgi:hypothetical protein
MDQLDLTVFAERYRLIALLDRDPGSDRVRRRFVQRCEELRIPVHRLNRYSIENYFSVRALREIFKGQIPDELVELPHDSAIESVLGISVKRNSRKIAERMTLEEIADTDLLEFLLSILEAAKAGED